MSGGLEGVGGGEEGGVGVGEPVMLPEDAWRALQELRVLVEGDPEGVRELLGAQGRLCRGVLEALGSVGVLRAGTPALLDALRECSISEPLARKAIDDAERRESQRAKEAGGKGVLLELAEKATPGSDAAQLVRLLAQDAFQDDAERVFAQQVRWALGADQHSLQAASEAEREHLANTIQPGIEQVLREGGIDLMLLRNALAKQNTTE